MKFTFAPESRPLEGFTIKRAIYRGGFGEVYYALTDAGREVALKLLQNNTEVELRGVQQCLNLSHPNLVTIFDVRQDGDGDHWIIMEYIGGDTLDVAIRRYPDGMPMQEVRRWLPGLAAGVGFLHDRGIVHRDLKPGNVFIENSVVKVGDVGLSKFITPSRRSAQTQSVGTVYYMAPEVAKGKYGKEVDVYALGIILYEMLMGKVPFDGESTGEILMKHLSEPPNLAVLPPRIRPIIGKALEKDPARRYHSVGELATAFDNAVLGRRTALEIPEESFVAAPRQAAQPGQVAAATRAVSAAAQSPSLKRNETWWWWVAAAALLLWNWDVLPGPPFHGGSFFEAAARTGMLLGIAYGLYAVVRWGARGSASSPAHATPVLTAAAVEIPVSPGPPPRRAANRACRPFENARAAHHSKRLNPLTPRTISARSRLTHWTSTAALAAVCTTVLLAGVGYLSPELFANASGATRLDPAAIGLIGFTTLFGAWAITGTTKLLEGRKVENSTRRLALLAAGCAVGAAAWGLGEFLMVHTASRPEAAFGSVGSRPLVDASHSPTLEGYLVFFGGLFGLRRWWWHTDEFRPKRFRVSSVLLTVAVAWLLSHLWAFPHAWAVLWAALLSSVVQLASVWTPPGQRSV